MRPKLADGSRFLESYWPIVCVLDDSGILTSVEKTHREVAPFRLKIDPQKPCGPQTDDALFLLRRYRNADGSSLDPVWDAAVRLKKVVNHEHEHQDQRQMDIERCIRRILLAVEAMSERGEGDGQT